mgnify:CR=1 FL=1
MKSKRKTRVFGLIIILLLMASSGFLIYNLILLQGIETFYRIMLILFIIFFDFLIIKGLFTSCFRNFKKIKFTLLSIISIILILIYGTGGTAIFILYDKLNDFNKDKITYTSDLITLKSGVKNVNKLKNDKIGIIKDTNDIEGYIIPQEMIKDEKLKDDNEIIEYEDSLEMMEDLYEEEIDAAFVSSNYKITFSNIESYKNIENETQVILEKSKTMKKNEKESEKKSLDEPFTMLLLGVDSEKDGLNPNQAFNGDTIMMITFNPKTLNATMFSIPRDTYVPISCNGNRENKINSAAYGGSECMIDTVENLTGIPIDYYAKINFKGVVELVDALGGITVDVPINFCEQNSDRLWGSKQICLKKGEQKLNGEQALALSRHRKTLALGDFARGQNQQLVVEGMLKQLKNINSATDFYDILTAISKNIDTNLTTNQILSLYNVGKRMMFSDDSTFNIQKTFLRGYDQYVGGMYTFQYYKGSLADIIEVMEINLGIKKATPVKEFSFSINDEYERYVAGDSEYNEARRTDLQSSSYSDEEEEEEKVETNNTPVVTPKEEEEEVSSTEEPIETPEDDSTGDGEYEKPSTPDTGGNETTTPPEESTPNNPTTTQ